jgi:hypothetical protein
MSASTKLNDASRAISDVSDALFLSQAVVINVTNFLQDLSKTFKGFEDRPQRSR